MSGTDSYHFLLSFAFRLCFLKQQRITEMSALSYTETTGNPNPNKTVLLTITENKNAIESKNEQKIIR